MISPKLLEPLIEDLGLAIRRREQVFERTPKKPLGVGQPGSEFYERERHYFGALQPRGSKLGEVMAGNRIQQAERLASEMAQSRLGRPPSLSEMQALFQQHKTTIEDLSEAFHGLETQGNLSNQISRLHNVPEGEVNEFIEKGRKFKDQSPIALEGYVRTLSPAQHEAYLVGVARTISDMTPGARARIVDNSTMRSRLRAVVRDAQAYDGLIDRIEGEPGVPKFGVRALAAEEGATRGKQDWGKPAFPVKSPDAWIKEALKKSGGNRKIAHDYLIEEHSRAVRAGYTRKARNLKVALARLRAELRNQLLATWGTGAAIGAGGGAVAGYLLGHNQ